MISPQQQQPPKSAKQLLRWWAKGADIEDLLGDMDEEFKYRLAQQGRLSAKFGYVRNALSLILSYSLKQRKQSVVYSHYYSGNSSAMYGNYFKIALRNFSKQKLFTAINIGGLSMGMSVSLLIVAVLSQVVQFDDFQENKNEIFRVLTQQQDIEGQRTFASTSVGLFNALEQDYSGLKNVVRINDDLRETVLHHDNEFEISGVYTDPNYFEVFSFELSAGDKNTALQKPYSIILSQATAQKLFLEINPIGKVLTTKSGQNYTVTGVLAPHPRQTHLSYEVIASMSTLDSQAPIAHSASLMWSDNRAYYVYLHLEEDQQPDNLKPILAQLSAQANRNLEGMKVDYQLQAFTDISPGKNLYNDNTPFDWLTAVALFCLGLLILIPACFNYANLMIGRALKRSKEIGIRKVVGGSKQQIVFQFLVESVLLTMIALIGTMFIFTLIRGEFISMIRGAETLDLQLSVSMIITFIVFGLLAGISAGLFPALYFSKIQPLTAFKSASSSGKINISNIRKSLIVVQFVISLVFIIGISVIAKQHKDILSYHLGFEKENILAVPLKGLDGELLANEFRNIAGVQEVSLCSNMPGVETGLVRTFVRQSDNVDDSLMVYEMYVDKHLLPSLGLDLLWGENLDYTSQTNEPILVNETFMRRGKTINANRDSVLMKIGQQNAHISGVLKDFNFMQLNMAIAPLIIRYAPDRTNYALLKVDGQNILQTIDHLETKWGQIDQEKSFESFFLDHQIEASYQSVFSIIKVVGFLGALSITISCIGLLGMVVYFTENHIKEVAIRKIMGASLIDLYRVLGSSFVKLLTIATVIAAPLAFLFYDQVFVQMISKYSVGVGWLEIVGSILFMFVLGGLPILWMVSRLSHVNPAINLRHE